MHNKFSVKYYLNLVLVDEEDRRYFKQQEIQLYRQTDTGAAEGAKDITQVGRPAMLSAAGMSLISRSCGCKVCRRLGMSMCILESHAWKGPLSRGAAS